MKEIEQIKEITRQYVETQKFQNQWKNFQEKYGYEIDGIVGENALTKLHFAEMLANLESGKLQEALRSVNSFQSLCRTDAQKSIYQRIYNECLNIDEMSKVQVNDWIKDDHYGYWQVLKIENNQKIIKNAFDKEFLLY